MEAKELECGDSLDDESLLSLCFYHHLETQPQMHLASYLQKLTLCKPFAYLLTYLLTRLLTY